MNILLQSGIISAIIAVLASIIFQWINRFQETKKRIRQIKSSIIEFVYYEYRIIRMRCENKCLSDLYAKLLKINTDQIINYIPYMVPGPGEKNIDIRENLNIENKRYRDELTYYGEQQTIQETELSKTDAKLTALMLELRNLKDNCHVTKFRNLVLIAREFDIDQEINFPKYDSKDLSQLTEETSNLPAEIYRTRGELDIKFKEEIYQKLENASKKF